MHHKWWDLAETPLAVFRKPERLCSLDRGRNPRLVCGAELEGQTWQTLLGSGLSLRLHLDHLPSSHSKEESCWSSNLCCAACALASVRLLLKSDLHRHPVVPASLWFWRKKLDLFLQIKALSQVPPILVMIQAPFAVLVVKLVGIAVIFQSSCQ